MTAATDGPVIDVEGLCKRFDTKVVVDNLSLQVERGEIFGFLGPNGSGKTTSIRMMCGLLTPDAGQGRTLGFDVVREAPLIRREVGYMTQRFGLYDDLTLRENLEFIGRMYGMDRRRERVNDALHRLGLEGRQKQLAGSLSGGWKQRLALAACMLHEPRLLLLDEPTAGVDPKARREFWDELHELARQGITVLVSTHYMDEAERCHRLAYIAWGRLLAQGTASELIAGSGLHTLVLSGPGAGELTPQLQGCPGVTLLTRFGSQLHVSGPNRDALHAAVASVQQPDLRIRDEAPGLEDVFIHLMRQAADNFA